MHAYQAHMKHDRLKSYKIDNILATTNHIDLVPGSVSFKLNCTLRQKHANQKSSKSYTTYS